MQHKIGGCLHVHIRKGRVVNIFSHLSNFPKECVIHARILSGEQQSN